MLKLQALLKAADRPRYALMFRRSAFKVNVPERTPWNVQGEPALEQQALLQAQRRREDVALGSAIEYNEALIEERDQGIAEIQRQIGEVREH